MSGPAAQLSEAKQSLGHSPLRCRLFQPLLPSRKLFEQCGCCVTDSNKICWLEKAPERHKKEPRAVHAPGVSAGGCLSL